MLNELSFLRTIKGFKTLQTLLDKIDMPHVSADALKTELGALIAKSELGEAERNTINLIFAQYETKNLFDTLIKCADDDFIESQRTSILTSLNNGVEKYESKQFDIAFLKRYLLLHPLVMMLSELEGFDETAIATYKLSALFKETNEAINYLLNFANNNNIKNPLNDAILFSLSDFELIEDGKDKDLFRDLAKTNLTGKSEDKSFFELLSMASKVLPVIKAPILSNLANFLKGIKGLNEKSQAKLTVTERVALGIDADATKAFELAVLSFVKKQTSKIKGFCSLSKEEQEAKKAEFKAAFLQGPGKGTRKGHLKNTLNNLKALKLKTLLDISKYCHYARGIEHPNAARILSGIKIPENTFNSYLDLIKKTPPQSSDALLPPVFIDGNTHACKGFYIIKLSANDPKGAFLGYPTGCCQSIGGLGHDCAVYGTVEKNAGFYVLCKGTPSHQLKRAMINAQKKEQECDTTDLISAKSIVAQSWVWRTFDEKCGKYSDVAVFDNIEVSDNLGKGKRGLLVKMYKLLANELVNESIQSKSPIKKINIGKSPSPYNQLLREEKVNSPKILRNEINTYTGYSDADNQALFYEKNIPYIQLLTDFERAINEFDSFICDAESLQNICYKLPCFSLEQANRLIDKIKEKGKKIPFTISLYKFAKNASILLSVICKLKEHLDFLEKNESILNLLRYFIDMPQVAIEIFSHTPEELRAPILLEKRALYYNDISFLELAIKNSTSLVEGLLKHIKYDEQLPFFLKLKKEFNRAINEFDSVISDAKSLQTICYKLPCFSLEQANRLIDKINEKGKKIPFTISLYKFTKNDSILLSVICKLKKHLDFLEKNECNCNVVRYFIDTPEAAIEIFSQMPEDLRVPMLLEKHDIDYHLPFIEFAIKNAPALVDGLLKHIKYDQQLPFFLKLKKDFERAINEFDSLICDAESLQMICRKLGYFSLDDASRLLDKINKKGEEIPFTISLFIFDWKEVVALNIPNKLQKHLNFLQRRSWGQNLLHLYCSAPEIALEIFSHIPKELRLGKLLEKSDKEYGAPVLEESIELSPSLVKALLNHIEENDRLAAIVQSNMEKSLLFSVIDNLPLMKDILNTLPEEKRLVAIKSKTKDGKTLLHSLVNHPDTMKYILGCYPKEERLTAILEKTRRGDSVLHQTSNNPITLEYILEMFRDKERLALLQEKNDLGETVLHKASHHLESAKVIINVTPLNQLLSLLNEKNSEGMSVLDVIEIQPELLTLILDRLPLREEDFLERLDRNVENNNFYVFQQYLQRRPTDMTIPSTIFLKASKTEDLRIASLLLKEREAGEFYEEDIDNVYPLSVEAFKLYWTHALKHVTEISSFTFKRAMTLEIPITELTELLEKASDDARNKMLENVLDKVRENDISHEMGKEYLTWLVEANFPLSGHYAISNIFCDELIKDPDLFLDILSIFRNVTMDTTQNHQKIVFYYQHPSKRPNHFLELFDKISSNDQSLKRLLEENKLALHVFIKALIMWDDTEILDYVLGKAAELKMKDKIILKILEAHQFRSRPLSTQMKGLFQHLLPRLSRVCDLEPESVRYYLNRYPDDEQFLYENHVNVFSAKLIQAVEEGKIDYVKDLLSSTTTQGNAPNHEFRLNSKMFQLSVESLSFLLNHFNFNKEYPDYTLSSVRNLIIGDETFVQKQNFQKVKLLLNNGFTSSIIRYFDYSLAFGIKHIAILNFNVNQKVTSILHDKKEIKDENLIKKIILEDKIPLSSSLLLESSHQTLLKDIVNELIMDVFGKEIDKAFIENIYINSLKYLKALSEKRKIFERFHQPLIDNMLDLFLEMIKENKIYQSKNELQSVISRHANWDNSYFRVKLPHIAPLFMRDTTCYSLEGFDETVYQAILPYIKARCADNNREHASDYALKLVNLFSDKQEIIDYLDHVNAKNIHSKQPVHDACLFNLPKKGNWDKANWKLFIKKNNYSKKSMALLSFASDIDHLLFSGFHISPTRFEKDIKPNGALKNYRDYCFKLIKQKIDLKGKKASPKHWQLLMELFPMDYQAFSKFKLTQNKITSAADLESKRPIAEFVDFYCRRRDFDKITHSQIINIILNHFYHDIPEKYYSFGLDCIKHGIAKDKFEEAIQLLSHHKKSFDYLDNIQLDEKRLGYPNLIFEKVPYDDPNAFILGKQTACCQSIDGHSRDCVLHGFKSHFGGFYRLRKTDGKMIAQSWVGITQYGEICFDSIEHNKGYNIKMILDCYQKLAEQLLENNPLITRVLFGAGGNTPAQDTYKVLAKKNGAYSPIIGYKDIGYDSQSTRYVLAEQKSIITDKSLLDSFKKQIFLAKGRDTYVEKDKEVKGLSLSPFYRHQFFRKHPAIKKSLLANELNPLLEEGRVGPNRNREGEYFLTFDILKALIHKKIVDKSKEPNTRYRVNHVITSDNNDQDFKEQLSNIELKDGETILVICMEGVHAYAAYIEKRVGKLYCFGFDSEGSSDEADFIMMLQETYPDMHITTSEALLQYDYYSCGVFAIKALMYFAKHGHTLFENGYFNQTTLSANELPAELLKLAQPSLISEKTLDKNMVKKSIVISNKQAETVVSRKAGLTLFQYRKVHTIEIEGKTFSSAPLEKKYKYMEHAL